MEELFELIIEYSKKGLILDRKFIEHAVSTFSKENHLENYVKKVDFQDECFDKNTFMYYEWTTRMIMVVRKKIQDQVEIVKDSLQFEKEYDKILTINISIFRIILHEFEHVNQQRKMDFNTDLESKILLCSCPLQSIYKYDISEQDNLDNILNYMSQMDILVYTEFIKHYYSILPHERLANLYSFKELADLFEIFKNDIPESTKDIYKIFHINEQFNGYLYDESSNELKSPTLRYFNLLSLLNNNFINSLINASILKQIENPTCVDFDTRLLLGLPIKNEECYAKQKELEKTNVNKYFKEER